MKKVQVINIKNKLYCFTDYWSPKIIDEFNANFIKLAKFKGEYVWHKHDNEDEMFFVLSGDLIIELRDKKLALKPGECVVIPKGVEHKPVAATEVAVMLIEPKSTLSTGDAVDVENKKATHGEWI